MIIFLLLVIIAILLFGASAVLGVAGIIAGFVVLVVALALLVEAMKAITLTMVVIAAGCIAAAIIGLFGTAAIMDRRAASRREIRGPFRLSREEAKAIWEAFDPGIVAALSEIERHAVEVALDDGDVQRLREIEHLQHVRMLRSPARSNPTRKRWWNRVSWR